MVKHVILWQLKDELTEEEKRNIAREIKEGLEGLKGTVESIVDIHVQIDYLDSSNAQVMLDSTFEDEEGLEAYATHPEHLNVAKTKVVPYVKSRVCMDYEV